MTPTESSIIAVEIAAGPIQLLPLAPRDAVELLEHFRDPEIRYWAGAELPTTAQEMDAWLERRAASAAQGSRLAWTIRTAIGGELAGMVEIHGIDLAPDSLIGELGYHLGAAHRGRGFATIAVGAVTRYAMQGLGLHRVQLMHAVGNDASCAVAQRAGFPLEGTLRHTGSIDGTWVDEHMHARLATDLGN